MAGAGLLPTPVVGRALEKACLFDLGNPGGIHIALRRSAGSLLRPGTGCALLSRYCTCFSLVYAVSGFTLAVCLLPLNSTAQDGWSVNGLQATMPQSSLDVGFASKRTMSSISGRLSQEAYALRSLVVHDRVKTAHPQAIQPFSLFRSYTCRNIGDLEAVTFVSFLFLNHIRLTRSLVTAGSLSTLNPRASRKVWGRKPSW